MKHLCCIESCKKLAQWLIKPQDEPFDYWYSCSEHISIFLTSQINLIYPVQREI